MYFASYTYNMCIMFCNLSEINIFHLSIILNMFIELRCEYHEQFWRKKKTKKMFQETYIITFITVSTNDWIYFFVISII